jgi:hypothetical protein
LFRNFFCVVKTLAPKDSLLFDLQFPNAISPLSEVPLIDFAIAATQIPAVYFFFAGGWSTVVESFNKSLRFKKLLIVLDQVHHEDLEPEQDGISAEMLVVMMRHAITSDLKQAAVHYYAGFFQMLVGISFVFFSLNSLHIRGATHPAPVYYSVVALLTGLSYFLHMMLLSMNHHARNASLGRRLRKKLRGGATFSSVGEVIWAAHRVGYTHNLLQVLHALTATRENGASGLSLQYGNLKLDARESLLADLVTLRAAALSLRATDAEATSSFSATSAAVAVDAGAEQEVQEPEVSTATRRRSRSSAAVAAAAASTPSKPRGRKSAAAIAAAASAAAAAVDSSAVACKEFVVPSALTSALSAHVRAETVSLVLVSAFFALNFVAGYGYLMPLLAYFCPAESFAPDAVLGPAVVRTLMFHYPTATAEWWGNMAGDVAWTLEPILALCSPMLIGTVQKVLYVYMYM